MVSCSSSASRSPSRRSLGTCAATRGHRLRAGGRFSAITSTALRRSTSLSCRRSHSKFLYCLVIVRHGRRLWVSFGVTAKPTAEWISRQVIKAFPWDHAPRYLIRDRGASYGPVFFAADPSDGHSGPSDRTPIALEKCLFRDSLPIPPPNVSTKVIVFGEAHPGRSPRKNPPIKNVKNTHLNKKRPPPPPR